MEEGRAAKITSALAALACLLILEFARPQLSDSLLKTQSSIASTAARAIDRFQLPSRGPWLVDGTTGPEWTTPSRCNPYSGRCSCLEEWGVAAACDPTIRAPTVRLAVHGWMTDPPYSDGMHRCGETFCDVMHVKSQGVPPASDAALFSVTNAANERLNPGKSILVGVALESRSNYPLHAEPRFKNFFHIGVSYAAGHLDLQTSYNNYYPAQFASRGAPFAAKRNGLAFMHHNCNAKVRNSLVAQVSALASVESFGACHHNLDVSAVLPQCADLPRTGSTVWLESECILHHYKFYLAIENSRDVDYVTEKLYQGLRAGAVPIYWGALNVRMYLPHPSAAILFDDFPNVSTLIDYVKKASADEVLYEHHMKWKAAPLSNDFMQRVVQRPVDGIFCQVCDAVARGLASHTLGPIVGGKGGEPVVLPPCILAALRGSTSSIVRNWAKLTGGTSSHVPTYVLSIASAHKRHEFIRSQLQLAGLSADFVGAFDAETMSNATFDCLNPRSPLDGRPLQEHPYSIPGPRVVSLISKHFAAAWDVFSRGLEYALFLEDDALLLGSFAPSIARALVEAPATWHMIFLGECLDLHVSAADASKLLWPRREARCSHAYLLSYEGARLMLDSLPMRWTIDFHINMAAESGSWEIYWAEPPSALQSKDFVSLLEVERSRRGVNKTA